MITSFKLFEEIEIKETLIIDDIIDYFNSDNDRIHNFIFSLFIFNHNVVEFECKKCKAEINGATTYINSHKNHKGIVCGIGYGFDKDSKQLYLSLTLKRIKYDHDVNTEYPIIIHGCLSDEIRTQIQEINMIAHSKKYNL